MMRTRERDEQRVQQEKMVMEGFVGLLLFFLFYVEDLLRREIRSKNGAYVMETLVTSARRNNQFRDSELGNESNLNYLASSSRT